MWQKCTSFFHRLYCRLIPQREDDKRERLRKLLFLAALLIFLGSGVFLLIHYLTTAADKAENDTLRSIYYSTAQPEAEAVSGNTAEQPALPETLSPEVEAFYEENPDALHNFAGLLEINPDTIGWIRVGDTGIDYPVFRGTDNDFYLKHDSQQAYSRSGSVFADYRTSIEKGSESDITILYAHNMESNGEYFEKLTNYSPWENGLSYYCETPVIDFDTLYEAGKWKIFGAVYCTVDENYGEVFHYPDKVDFKDKDDFFTYMADVMNRSLFYTDVDIQYGDQLLVMSTCYFPVDRNVNGRIVLYARKVRKGESPEVDVSKAVVNEDPLLFRYYYQKMGGQWNGGSWDHTKLVGYDRWLKQQEKEASEASSDTTAAPQ